MGNDANRIAMIAQSFLPSYYHPLGDVYAELYDWEGNFVERTLLDSSRDYYQEVKELYDLLPSAHRDFDLSANYNYDNWHNEDFLDIEQLEDGFLIRDKSGEELGKVHIDNPEQMKIMYINGFLRIWREEDYASWWREDGSFEMGRFYWLDLE